MSTERDELRGTLCNTVCNVSNYTKRAQPYLLGSDMSAVLDKTADAILAAGYRKPYTIATIEELDALPWRSVIRSDEGAVFEKFTMWHEAGSRDLKYSPDIALPATVLHEGEGEP